MVDVSLESSSAELKHTFGLSSKSSRNPTATLGSNVTRQTNSLGIADGKKDGEAEGCNDGVAEGFKDGTADGVGDGIMDGWPDGR